MEKSKLFVQTWRLRELYELTTAEVGYFYTCRCSADIEMTYGFKVSLRARMNSISSVNLFISPQPIKPPGCMKGNREEDREVPGTMAGKSIGGDNCSLFLPMPHGLSSKKL